VLETIRHLPILLTLRPEREKDAFDRHRFEWHRFEGPPLVHRVDTILTSIVSWLTPLFERFYWDDELGARGHCGAVQPGKEPPEAPAGCFKLWHK